jgi:simple sugar transport system permease protein/ribose transport system permease protein
MNSVASSGSISPLGRVLGGWKRFKERGVLMVLVGLCVIFSLTTTTFLQLTNMINIMRQISEICISAIGMTFVIICAEIDLSVGSIYGLSAMFAALILRSNLAAGLTPLVALLGALAAGGVVGFFNGMVTTKLRVPAFIVTLSMLSIGRGALYGLSGGYAISIFPKTAEPFFWMGNSVANVFPRQIILMLVIAVIGAIVLSKSTFGFQIYATGGNRKAADLTGINTDRIKIAAFVICGLMAALSGTISLSYLQSVHPSAGNGREMDVVAAVILGGTYLYGGRGTILGTFIGAAIIGVVRNGMVLMSVPAYSQEALIGGVILLAVVADIWLRREKA